MKKKSVSPLLSKMLSGQKGDIKPASQPAQAGNPIQEWLKDAIKAHQSGQLEEAARLYQRILAVDARHIVALTNLGTVYLQRGNREEGVRLLALSLEQESDQPHALNNLGHALNELRRFQEALSNLDRAIALKPESASAFNNRGNALKGLRRYEEALSSYDRAMALKPDYPEAFLNRGIVLKTLARFQEARSSFDRAIALKPDDVDAHWEKAALDILSGNYEEGWKLYEWRWKKPDIKKYVRNFHQPLWLGDTPVSGKTVLLHAEQGLGDTIQMLRYVPLLAEQGARVIVEVPSLLATTALSVPGVSQVVRKGGPLPDFDLHCPLMSLPRAFKTDVSTIPSMVPYLFASDDSKNRWRERLGHKHRPRIGLVWSGAAGHKNDFNRSIPLQILSPILDREAEFYSLQKEYREGEWALLQSDQRIRDCSSDLNDFDDTAGLIEQLDRVISVDTSVAHLAGALGKPVWILLPTDPDYRWMTDRQDSPWYPTARLFRQGRFEDWATVINRVMLELDPLKSGPDTHL